MKTPFIIPLFVFILCMAGCASGTSHVSPEKFKVLYAATPSIGTMYNCNYIGHSYDRAYIEESWMRLIGGSWKYKIYYVYLNELDPMFRNDLLNQKPQKPQSVNMPELKNKFNTLGEQPIMPASASAIKY